MGCPTHVPFGYLFFINDNSISQYILRSKLKPWLGQSRCNPKSAITIPIQEMRAGEKKKKHGQLAKTFSKAETAIDLHV